MKLMDKLGGSSVKNLFATKPEPELVQNADTAPLAQTVLDITHIRRDGETYNQYGFRVAGLSEGNPHTFLSFPTNCT